MYQWLQTSVTKWLSIYSVLVAYSGVFNSYLLLVICHHISQILHITTAIRNNIIIDCEVQPGKTQAAWKILLLPNPSAHSLKPIGHLQICILSNQTLTARFMIRPPRLKPAL